MTPAQRHAGADRHVLQARHELYQQARESKPRRWSRHTRNWQRIEVVTLNPERDPGTRTPAGCVPDDNKQPLAA